MIELGRGMIFPDSYGRDQPDGPDLFECSVCTEDRWEGEACEECGGPAPDPGADW